MLIVGFGKTFTIHDQAPKKLIMKTLARAAMENDQELEEEDTYWLRGETPNGEFYSVVLFKFKIFNFLSREARYAEFLFIALH